MPTLTVHATDPLVSGSIGGPGVSIPIHISGAIGPNNAPLFGSAGLFSLTKGSSSSIGLILDGGLGTFGIGVPIDLVTDPSLGIKLDKVNVTAIPLYANLGVSTDLPVSLGATPIHISGLSIDPVQVGPGLILNAAIKMSKTPPAAGTIFGNPCGVAVPCTAIQLQPVINAGPISLGPSTWASWATRRSH